MRYRIGHLWIGLGVFHLVLIGVLGAGELADIVGAGLLNGLGDSIADLAGSAPDRAAVFWLFYLGVPMILVGMVVRWAQSRLGPLPVSFGWATVLFATLGWVIVPASGFPLVLALGVYTIVATRREGTERALNGVPVTVADRR